MNRGGGKKTHSGWPQHFQPKNHEGSHLVDSRESTYGIQRWMRMKMT